MNFEQAIQYLQSFPDAERGSFGATGPNMSLTTMKNCLERMGNPQTSARTIHITGSKGKGSTATFIASIFKAAGLKTALYTSPHLHTYRERIAFDLEPVSETDFAAGLTSVRDVLLELQAEGEGPYSTFGVLTALFFQLVGAKMTKSDWQIVEVGLGGTFDATNVFPSKDFAIITAISLEHTAILGRTIAEIVKNKAGIITPDSTCILAPQRDPTVKGIVQEICEERHAQLIDVQEFCRFEAVEQLTDGQKFANRAGSSEEIFTMRMLGQHQLENAATAATTLKILQDRGNIRTNSALQKGLSQAVLPGRFEVLPILASGSPNGKEIMVVLDGAHNQDSASALAKTLEQVFPGKKCQIILGINRDKNIESIWQELETQARALIATKSDNARAMPPQEIIEKLCQGKEQLSFVATKDINEALQRAFSQCTDSDLICVTGSLYLVAEAREILLKRYPKTSELQQQPI